MEILNVTVPERRRQTRSSIYRCLYQMDGFCSRQTLAQRLNLSLPTIYQNLDELIGAGLVRYSGESQATGGRKANGLEIVAQARISLGVSVTEDRLRIVAADLRLNELAYHKVSYTFTTMDQLGRLLAREIEDFLDRNALDRSKLLGVGITFAGVVSAGGDRLLYVPSLGLRDVGVEDLVDKIPYPVFVENDATSSGYAEWFKRGDGGDMAYLSLESGVGGTLLLGGAVAPGENRRSGEFGHMCVEPGGLPCRCGKRGCLEAYCSPWRISSDLGVTLDQFFQGLEEHVPEYEVLWNDLLRHLAHGISNIRMVMDVDVVLGGLLTQYMPPYMPLLRRYVSANDPFQTDTDYLQLSILRGHAVPLGAALHFIQEFLRGV